MTTPRHDPDWMQRIDSFYTGAPEDPDQVVFDAHYADAEAARQDATAPYETPRCAADVAAQRRLLDAKFRNALWMMQQVEDILTEPRP